MSDQELIAAATKADQELVRAMLCPKCVAEGRGESKLRVAGVANLDPVEGVWYRLECDDKNPCGFTTTLR